MQLTILFNSGMDAQELSFEILNTPNGAVLFQLEGEKVLTIDSLLSKKNKFKFTLIDKPHGMYKFQLDNSHWINFINDGNDILLITDYNHILDSLKLVKSESNKLFYEFLKLNKSYKTKTELLQLMLARYPQDDEYYATTQKKLLEVQNDYQQFVKITSQIDPNSFIAKYIKSAQLPKIDGTLSIEEQLDYLKKHSLDNVDFNDDEMIYSDLFASKSIEYLTYYRNPQFPKPLLEKAFIAAVDTILTKAKANNIVYQHITDYLIDGFTKFGFDNIIDYIITNYVLVDDLCINEETENSIQNRVNQAKILKIGVAVPNIILPDNSGKDIDLSELTSEKVLILFYASWCTHCQTMIPQIKELYDNSTRKELEVLAVSLDTNKIEWAKFLVENNLKWLNASDLKGWDSQAAESYYIYATPTMFLVDKDKKIIAKPLTIEDLKQHL